MSSFLSGRNFGSNIQTSDIADDAITLAKLANGTANQNIQYNASGVPVDVALPASGKVLQVVNDQTGASLTNTTNMSVDDTIPQSNEGGEVLSVAITPSSSSNKLLIQVHVNLNSSSQQGIHAALFQDSTANALAAQTSYVDGGHWANSMSFNHFMTSGTTSETTFKVRVGANSGSTTRINGTSGTRRDGGVGSTSITVTEISA